MGICFSSGHDSEESKQSEKIDEQLRASAKQASKEVKLLLLGTGESGKSTIAKQMKIIHKDGFTIEERQEFRIHVLCNILHSMKLLVCGVKKLRLDFDNDLSREAAANIMYLPTTHSSWSSATEGDIRVLLSDHGVQTAMQHASQLQLGDSAKYFFERLDVVVRPDYLPNDEDILRARVQTTAIAETEFDFGGLHFRMIDVGGQRTERRKWIHQFQDVTALLFCVSLAEYDQVIAEDGKTNRMDESLVLFSEIVNLPWFHDTPVILFLNKKDIFAEKLPSSPLNKAFPQYTAGDDVKQAMTFIQHMFVARSKNQKKEIYCHFTCATDTTNVEAVFRDVRDIILQQKLQASMMF